MAKKPAPKAKAPTKPRAKAPARKRAVEPVAPSFVAQQQPSPPRQEQARWGRNTQNIDRMVRALQSRFTQGLSPASLLLAYLDWLVHLGGSAGKLSELAENAAGKTLTFLTHAGKALAQGQDPGAYIEPLSQDKRFAGPEWGKWPFNLYVQNFLLAEQWWHYATTGVSGLSKHHEDVVSFAARQMLDMMAPSNFLLSNPDVLKATMEEGGQNLVRGFKNFLEDVERARTGDRPEAAKSFAPGQSVAVTPGHVVLRNELIELIQYAPTTPKVQAEPILIVPAWIMKYYILDLSAHNSLVKYLVDKGHTVFIISWKNPTADDRHLGMEDYRKQGVIAALDAISAIVPKRKIHAAGYCLGGTLLSIAAAAMARDGDERLASMTLFAAQVDFEDAGEIMLFIDESQVTYLEDQMWDKGVLDTKQMAGAFQVLRSNDLIWSRVVSHYLLGKPDEMNDLMAWNADATRMPYRMHSEYLRHLFLGNELAKGRYLVEDRPVALTDIRCPVFAVGTSKDHVAPWKSVFKIGILTDTEVTFLLTAGGHNAGIVSEPGKARRSFQMATRKDLDKFVDADSWANSQPSREGSWWPAWEDWISKHSSGTMAPPRSGNPKAGYPVLAQAPGSYVLGA